MKIIIVMAALLLTACASRQPAQPSIAPAANDTVFVEASPKVDPAPEPPAPPVVVREIVQAPAPKPAPATPTESAKVLKEAAAAATRSPGNFVQGYQLYDYLPGAIYELYAAPGYVSTILLEPGEELIDAAAGDTVRWIVGDTTTGQGGKARTIIMVKPVEPGLKTNMVVTTDSRVYLLDLKSQNGAYNSAVAWNYPDEGLASRYRKAKGTAVRKGKDEALAGVSVERLDFGYTIKTVKGDEPRWKPIRVFNDGAKSYIEFPPNIGVMETPPLFVVGETDGPELVNYRVRAPYYVVDKLIDVAELRMGIDKPVVVRIERAGRYGGTP